MSVQHFFQQYREALDLCLVAGWSGGDRRLACADQVLVLDAASVAFPENFSSATACVVVCGQRADCVSLAQRCEQVQLPLFISSLNSAACREAVQRCFLPPVAPPSVHKNEGAIGTVVSVFGTGVLLLGPSGAGKSDLALALVDRGHALVVDDGPEWRSEAPGQLQAHCPQEFEGFMEVRGLGIINVVSMYGSVAALSECVVGFALRLGRDHKTVNMDRLTPQRLSHGANIKIQGVALPCIDFAVSAGRDRGLIVETAVRQFELSRAGYDAAQDVSARLATKLL